MDDQRPNFQLAMAKKRPSKNFTAADICCAGETWSRTKIWNEPQQAATWNTLELLCESILEPIQGSFGSFRITYGFASTELFRLIPSGTTKALDQHASCELSAAGKPLCPRLGAAVDFLVPNLSMRDVAIWVTDTLPFDRMYFYGDDRPLHVSVGPQHSKALVEMRALADGRLIPRNRRLEWLRGSLE